jgi:hypothetical protein
MVACPNCKRRIITRRDILYAPLDGTARCRACGRFARFDMFSRWVLSVLVAITLPALLLMWGVFYSGHLLLVSMLLIFGAARVVAWAALPFFTLEPVAAHIPLDHRQSAIILGALVAAALVLDGFIASRLDSESTQGTHAVQQVRNQAPTAH